MSKQKRSGFIKRMQNQTKIPVPRLALTGKASRHLPSGAPSLQQGFGYDSHDRLVTYLKQALPANDPTMYGPTDGFDAPAPSSYRYRLNALGHRVLKERYPNDEPWAQAQAARGFLYDQSGQLIAEVNPLTGAIEAETVWLGSMPVTHFTRSLPTPTAEQGSLLAPANGLKTYAVHSDHLNTPQVLTDANGQVAWQQRSDPYGNPMSTNGNGRDPVSHLPNEQASIVFNLRFPGQYFDAESRLHQNWNRDYDPALGRYIQSDPIGLSGGINTYVYVEGNPLSYTDPDGLNPRAAWGIGTGIGRGVNAATEAITGRPPGVLIYEWIHDDGKMCEDDAAGCDDEWEWAYRECEKLMNDPRERDNWKRVGRRPPTLQSCAAGYVSKRCGGNKIE